MCSEGILTSVTKQFLRIRYLFSCLVCFAVCLCVSTALFRGFGTTWCRNPMHRLISEYGRKEEKKKKKKKKKREEKEEGEMGKRRRRR